MIFKRKKANEQPEAAPAPEAAQGETEPKTGPFDYSDIEDTQEYLDFGSILIKPVTGMKVRMDVEESNKRVIAVSLEIAESRIQLMAFSSSKSESLWPGISDKIKNDINAQQGEIFTRDGEYGPELLAKVPQQLPDGRAGHVALRFVGIDGRRWFLRAVIGGAAISNEEAAGVVDEILRNVVVNRGDKPLPPAELLPLNVPSNAQTRPANAEQAPDLKRPERGPEITQIG
ncbi:MAG: DUF3710 domain-containing protein [Glutamicibacter arilaitensis]|jgi:hypothetical protein|uniref:DUF3710 domain-containing protein n=1 Tax=Glutamicibacter arilaitensis TaxID=256701 RepID=A0A4Y8TXE5_9MICC|nr:DUF3710 domain-containing protein [Glutamicibacter arilaitensis]TFH56860.1 DUF3710 domain-containing protein [Glutamicibacter arilaitensis]